MLGEKIVEESGRIVTQRVLPGDTPKMEISFQAAGTVLGTEHTDVGTYTAEMRPNGTLLGEGQGIIMTRDGQTVTWRGNGIGKFTANGAVAWRGAIYYETQSSKLARLNGAAGVFEYETTADGSTKAAVFEWR